MSLAAPSVPAAGPRASSFLPTIKCSNCGNEIEISAMGDHICAPAPPSPSVAAPIINPFTLRQMNASGIRQPPPPPQPQPQMQSNDYSRQNNASGIKAAQPSPPLSNDSLRQMNMPETKPAQPSPLQFNDNPGARDARPRATTGGSSQASFSRPQRPPPPRINSDVANQPFLGAAAQGSHSPASSVRSVSTSSSRRAPQPKRNMTQPNPRSIFDMRPPSPELSANLDCAFPPFPGAAPAPRKRKESNASSKSRMEPKSPRRNEGGEIMVNRMNTMKKGPLDSGSRRPSGGEKSQPDSRPLEIRPNQLTAPPTPIEEHPPEPTQMPEPSSFAPIQFEPPASGISDSGPPLVLRQPSGRKPPERPARPDEGLPLSLLTPSTANSEPTPTFLRPVGSLQPLDRSQTLPVFQRSNESSIQVPTLSKMASEPALRLAATRSPSPPPEMPALQTRNLSGDQSSEEERMDRQVEGAPALPRQVELHRSGSSYKSSESTSSKRSSMLSFGNLSLENSNTTSAASPVISSASSFDAFPAFNNSEYNSELESLSEEKAPQVPALHIKKTREPSIQEESPKETSPDRSLARSSSTEVAESLEDFPDPPKGSNWPLESPMHHLRSDSESSAGESEKQEEKPEQDLEKEQERMSEDAEESLLSVSASPVRDEVKQDLAPESPKLERLSSNVYDPTAPGKQRPSEESPRGRPPIKPTLNTDFQGFNFGTSLGASTTESPTALSPAAAFSPTEGHMNSRTPSPFSKEAPPAPQEDPLPSLTRQPTGKKAVCRGCNTLIEGKSVKAADGRLTGRWHKACFVCKTCREPFTTADFYVIDNQPYCEQHYHEKNGSVCHGCRKGIEGQFLETWSSGPQGRVARKYHRRCFTCVDCRMVLAEDYFEISGRVYCERHALAAMRSQARNRPPGPPGQPGLPRGSSRLRADPMRAQPRTTTDPPRPPHPPRGASRTKRPAATT